MRRPSPPATRPGRSEHERRQSGSEARRPSSAAPAMLRDDLPLDHLDDRLRLPRRHRHRLLRATSIALTRRRARSHHLGSHSNSPGVLVALRLYGSGDLTVNVGNLIPLLRDAEFRINNAAFPGVTTIYGHRRASISSHTSARVLHYKRRSIFWHSPLSVIRRRTPFSNRPTHALGGVLADVAEAESFEGKTGQSITVHTHGRIPARRVLVVGAGPRGEFANPNIRDLAATVAQTANKVRRGDGRVRAARARREPRGGARPARGRGRPPRHVQVRPLPHRRRSQAAAVAEARSASSPTPRARSRPRRRRARSPPRSRAAPRSRRRSTTRAI